MKTFTTEQFGRFVVMHLGKGERVIESVQSELNRLGIKSGVITSAIGSLRKVVFHIITNTEDNAANEFITIEEPIEVGAIQGIILDGKPHFHIVCSDTKRAYTGHLENGCEVQYLMEISIMEVKDMKLTRKPDQFKIDYIDYI